MEARRQPFDPAFAKATAGRQAQGKRTEDSGQKTIGRIELITNVKA